MLPTLKYSNILLIKEQKLISIIKKEEDFVGYYDFKTCLDNIEEIIEDTVLDDLEGYYYNVKSNYSTIHNNKVCGDKEDYEQLIAQSSLLFNLRKITILRNHIIATGGKRYSELNK
ncbi:hypothetical protein [Flavobacterium restrictum]|uniref:Uncharacterized protein n=1 Tax=Flavobacterium restrictum TaxID=2594428 RepID=A0A553E357_9FLAO|nr:hypothetical protein [Flavobacterium restrictum]TRX39467.1 hypothetical protein FNW21_09240 [Flavobacterium restrictum]